MTSFWASAPKEINNKVESRYGRFMWILISYWNNLINLKITILKNKLYKQLFTCVSIFSRPYVAYTYHQYELFPIKIDRACLLDTGDN